MTLELRTHQRAALAALEAAWRAGRTRAWVALPPGTGKTLVGLEAVRRRVAAGEVGRAVVLGPNTAIQAQWVAQAAAAGLDAGVDRALTATVTALTYQSLAVFDTDGDAEDDGTDDGTDGGTADGPGGRAAADGAADGFGRGAGAGTTLLSRLHDNGRALVEALKAAGPILLVLDECHHLLEVWGRLLGELLAELPEAEVLGLTATPPEALTAEQAELVDELFGHPLFQVSIPAVVREGDLAPFAELAWLTTPTPTEADYLASEAVRFAELVTALTDPEFGTLPFLTWLDRRFAAEDVPWSTIVKRTPELARAALRMHTAGLLGLPPGARVAEEHRSEPAADDWVVLVEDWLTHHPDEQVEDVVRRALPSVGYVWTRRGIRRGRSAVDRVLARSESKAIATVQIVGHEHLNLGDRLRMLVLCDHERAGATLPMTLRGVIDQQTGSARAMLAALVEDPDTRGLNPMLVTGSTVAGSADTLRAFRGWLTDTTDVAQVAQVAQGSLAALAAQLEVVELEGEVCSLVGPWRSRIWVALVTRFFQAGHTQVLVGTRGLLGEGWDAPRITGLVDLTAVTTITAVVQTRGRALRLDPAWADKVALTWTVTCVAEEHPKGANDWDRLVRKHSGFFGVDDDGAVVDGVGHLDAAFSPYAPPPATDFDAVNSRMLVRSEDRAGIRDRWRVGEAYDDLVAPTVRIMPRRAAPRPPELSPALVVAGADGLLTRAPTRPRPGLEVWGAGLLAVLGVAGGVVAGGLLAAVLLAVTVVALVAASALRSGELVAHGQALIAQVAGPPDVGRVASAVADGLLAAGLVSVGAAGVDVTVDSDGEYRCVLRGVPETEGAVFVTALEEVVSPLDRPRYVVPRWVASAAPGRAAALAAAYLRFRPDGVVWHAVPSVLGTTAGRAQAFATAWDRWVGGGPALYTGSPEGAGVLASQQGSDPFDVTTVMRRQWG